MTINQTVPPPDPTAEAQKAKRAEQARINGARSQGPTSIAGKAKSSKNSLKHGFSAKINVLIAPDDSESWDIHLAQHRNDYRPTNYVETDFVDQLASIRWRQARLVSIETALIDFQLSVQEEKVDEFFPDEAGNSQHHLALAWQGLARKAYPRVLPTDPNIAPDPTHPPESLDIDSIALVHRYQISLDRQFRNTLINLRQYRKDFAPTAQNEPQIVAEQNEPTSPSPKPPQIQPAPLDRPSDFTPNRPVDPLKEAA